jgi:hypothetical protein
VCWRGLLLLLLHGPGELEQCLELLKLLELAVIRICTVGSGGGDRLTRGGQERGEGDKGGEAEGKGGGQDNSHTHATAHTSVKCGRSHVCRSHVPDRAVAREGGVCKAACACATATRTPPLPCVTASLCVASHHDGGRKGERKNSTERRGGEVRARRGWGEGGGEWGGVVCGVLCVQSVACVCLCCVGVCARLRARLPPLSFPFLLSCGRGTNGSAGRRAPRLRPKQRRPH